MFPQCILDWLKKPSIKNVTLIDSQPRVSRLVRVDLELSGVGRLVIVSATPSGTRTNKLRIFGGMHRLELLVPADNNIEFRFGNAWGTEIARLRLDPPEVAITSRRLTPPIVRHFDTPISANGLSQNSVRRVFIKPKSRQHTLTRIEHEIFFLKNATTTKLRTPQVTIGTLRLGNLLNQLHPHVPREWIHAPAPPVNEKFTRLMNEGNKNDSNQ